MEIETNDIINPHCIIQPDHKLEFTDPHDDDMEDLDLTEIYGIRIQSGIRIIWPRP